jgi:hypothetical protein
VDSLVDSINSQTVLAVAAIAVSLIVLRLLLRVLNVGLGSLLTIAAIVWVMQYFFHISPNQIWLEIRHLPQDFLQFAKGLFSSIPALLL